MPHLFERGISSKACAHLGSSNVCTVVCVEFLHTVGADKLKVLAIDEAALDASTFNKNMYAMLGCVSGTRKNSPDSDIAIINAKKYITDKYIPTWINASNEGGENGPFAVEAKGVKAKLDEISCPCTMIYFPDENLPHGYRCKWLPAGIHR